MKILALGDTLLRTKNGEDPFKYVANLFFEADLVLVNLEACLLKKNKRYPNVQEKSVLLSTEQESLTWLHRYKEKLVFCLANNHILDYGKEGYEDTVTFLKESGYMYCPIDQHKDFEIKGQVLRVYSLAQHIKHKIEYQEMMLSAPKYESAPGLLNVVMIHWGESQVLMPSLKQIDHAQEMIDAGCSIVIGNHSHTPQPLVMKGTKNAIVYSLGNFNMRSHSVRQQPVHHMPNVVQFAISDSHTIQTTQVPALINWNMQPVIKQEVSGYLKEINRLIPDKLDTPFERFKYKLIYYTHLSHGFILGSISGGWIPRIKKYGISHFLQMLKWMASKRFVIHLILLPFYPLTRPTKLLRKINKLKLNEL